MPVESNKHLSFIVSGTLYLSSFDLRSIIFMYNEAHMQHHSFLPPSPSISPVSISPLSVPPTLLNSLSSLHLFSSPGSKPTMLISCSSTFEVFSLPSPLLIVLLKCHSIQGHPTHPAGAEGTIFSTISTMCAASNAVPQKYTYLH